MTARAGVEQLLAELAASQLSPSARDALTAIVRAVASAADLIETAPTSQPPEAQPHYAHGVLLAVLAEFDRACAKAGSR